MTWSEIKYIFEPSLPHANKYQYVHFVQVQIQMTESQRKVFVNLLIKIWIIWRGEIKTERKTVTIADVFLLNPNGVCITAVNGF